MARIQLMVRTKKTGDSKIKLRFRLTDGRATQLFHKSEIEVSVADAAKFEIDGTPKKRANFSRKLAKIIADRMALLQTVYDDCIKSGILLTSKVFEERIDMALHPEQYKVEEPKTKLLSERFDEFIQKGVFSEARKRGYLVTAKILKRYLQIAGRTSIQIDEVDAQFLMSFHQFVVNEYKYVKKYKRLYSDVKSSNVPTEPRDANTAVVKMKMLNAFFRSLETKGDIIRTPFVSLDKNERKATIREQYGRPFALELKELEQLINANDIPETLRATRDAFVLQCCLGCRISDFKKLSMRDIKVKDNIPYIEYIAQKTKEEDIISVQTPLVRYAFDIIKRTMFDLPIQNVSGQNGYNRKIRTLFETIGLDREITYTQDKKLITAPLYELASSKLARKTCVTLSVLSQIDKSASGLHKPGSKAADFYTDIPLSKLFELFNNSFGTEPYKVDRDLNIIND